MLAGASWGGTAQVEADRFPPAIIVEFIAYIRSVELDEEKSIPLPPRCLEASGVEFLKLVDKQ